MWMELFGWGLQGFDVCVKHSHARQPIIDVLSAISPGHATRTADREIDLPSRLIEFFSDLRARLPSTNHQNRAPGGTEGLRYCVECS